MPCTLDADRVSNAAVSKQNIASRLCCIAKNSNDGVARSTTRLANQFVLVGVVQPGRDAVDARRSAPVLERSRVRHGTGTAFRLTKMKPLRTLLLVPASVRSPGIRHSGSKLGSRSYVSFSERNSRHGAVTHQRCRAASPAFQNWAPEAKQCGPPSIGRRAASRQRRGATKGPCGHSMS